MRGCSSTLILSKTFGNRPVKLPLSAEWTVAVDEYYQSYRELPLNEPRRLQAKSRLLQLIKKSKGIALPSLYQHGKQTFFLDIVSYFGDWDFFAELITLKEFIPIITKKSSSVLSVIQQSREKLYPRVDSINPELCEHFYPNVKAVCTGSKLWDAMTQFQMGVSFKEKGDHSRAESCFRQAAVLGHDKAQDIYARCYLYDQHPDWLIWRFRSADQNNEYSGIRFDLASKFEVDFPPFFISNVDFAAIWFAKAEGREIYNNKFAKFYAQHKQNLNPTTIFFIAASLLRSEESSRNLIKPELNNLAYSNTSVFCILLSNPRFGKVRKKIISLLDSATWEKVMRTPQQIMEVMRASVIGNLFPKELLPIITSFIICNSDSYQETFSVKIAEAWEHLSNYLEALERELSIFREKKISAKETEFLVDISYEIAVEQARLDYTPLAFNDIYTPKIRLLILYITNKIKNLTCPKLESSSSLYHPASELIKACDNAAQVLPLQLKAIKQNVVSSPRKSCTIS